MMILSRLLPLASLALLGPSTAASVHSSASDHATIIFTWKVQSSAIVGNNAVDLSSSNLDTSSWYTIDSRATLMSTLLQNKVYNDTTLFFSDNLDKIDNAPFKVPWLYRAEIASGNSSTSHVQLKTNGITSRADIYLNGNLVADKDTQAGAYAGLTYDITPYVTSNENNVLLIRVYPTDYNRDLALGFVDWNPYPPDNGTGIWRDVEIKMTGPVGLLTPRVDTKLDGSVKVSVDVQSWVDSEIEGSVTCSVYDPSGQEIANPSIAVKIPGKIQQKVTIDLTIPNPQIWWPKQWGSQPLYSTACSIQTSNSTTSSDITPATKFGIRTITSNLDPATNTTLFTINNQPIQILGAGYTSDIFLRTSPSTLHAQLSLTLSMGLNTLRLEGKQEHPNLYMLADELGLLLLPGWECCDKWEAWTYNDEGSGLLFTDPDYTIINNSMRHEAQMMQSHPSVLGFLVGSDFWPDDRATDIYVSALRALDWQTPILASASQRGFPALLGNGGMKMDGPYDWVPPNYWYDPQHRLGSAGGFGSELGAGVGTPEINSLRKFLSESDLNDLWTQPVKGLYHMSTNVSSFFTREIYNAALWARYGAPTSLNDYLLKAQMADYEATRAQFEAWAVRWSDDEDKATGLVYWMLNNAWPSLHWNLFDYYLHPGGAFFGVKTAVGKSEHVVYDYATCSVHLINRSLNTSGPRTVEIDVVDVSGKTLLKRNMTGATTPNQSTKLGTLKALEKMKPMVFLRLVLKSTDNDTNSVPLSRNTYWLSPTTPDIMDWDNSTWYNTPVTSYANFTALETMARATVEITQSDAGVVLENLSNVPAVFVRLNLVDGEGEDVVPVFWSDNYVTLWPRERLEVGLEFEDERGDMEDGAGDRVVEVSGRNLNVKTMKLR